MALNEYRETKKWQRVAVCFESPLMGARRPPAWPNAPIYEIVLRFYVGVVML